jgi:hypothetical protein
MKDEAERVTGVKRSESDSTRFSSDRARTDFIFRSPSPITCHPSSDSCLPPLHPSALIARLSSRRASWRRDGRRERASVFFLQLLGLRTLGRPHARSGSRRVARTRGGRGPLLLRLLWSVDARRRLLRRFDAARRFARRLVAGRRFTPGRGVFAGRLVGPRRRARRVGFGPLDARRAWLRASRRRVRALHGLGRRLDARPRGLGRFGVRPLALGA